MTYWNGTNHIGYTNGIVGDSIGGNLFVNNLIERITSVTSSSTPISITASSIPNYVITGSTNQVFNMANATTLPKGATFTFNNNGTTGVDSIRNSSGTLIVSVPNGGYATLILNDSTTAAGSWDYHFGAPSSVQWSTNTFNLGNASITNASWNGSVIGSNKGGAGSVTGILKADGSGNVSAATAGTDYQAPVSAGTNISIASNTISVASSPTFSGSVTISSPANTTGSAATIDGTQTLSNKRWKARLGSTTSSATPTINTDNYDIYKLTAQAADITSFTTNLTGTPNDGDIFEIQITGTAARAITWGSSFVSSSVTLPTTTVTTATLTVVFQYFTTSSYGNNKWVCFATN